MSAIHLMFLVIRGMRIREPIGSLVRIFRTHRKRAPVATPLFRLQSSEAMPQCPPPHLTSPHLTSPPLDLRQDKCHRLSITKAFLFSDSITNQYPCKFQSLNLSKVLRQAELVETECIQPDLNNPSHAPHLFRR